MFTLNGRLMIEPEDVQSGCRFDWRGHRHTISIVDHARDVIVFYRAGKPLRRRPLSRFVRACNGRNDLIWVGMPDRLKNRSESNLARCQCDSFELTWYGHENGCPEGGQNG